MSDSDALLLGATGDGVELIRLTGVSARGRHGYLDQEKRDGQPFVVDLTLRLRRDADDDALAGTADYSVIAADVVRLIEGPPVDLIETLAQQIAARCLDYPAVAGVVCTVHKPEAPVGVPFGDVSVTVVRTRQAAQPFAVSLGSNMGDSATVLADAVTRLAGADGVRLTAVSSLYRTAPVGGVEQDDFLNAVVVGRTTRTPEGLLALCHEIEAAHGRTREVRWGPRTLDLDVLDYGGLTRTDPSLTLPHPRAHERAFVLVPWLESDAAARLPGHGPLGELIAQIGTDGVRRVEAPGWPAGPWTGRGDG